MKVLIWLISASIHSVIHSMPSNENDSLIRQIDVILPQTQCGQCGYSGCLPYETASAQGVADINQCPPGDEEGIRELAALLDVSYKPLNRKYGIAKPKAVALIDEAYCIGCTFCIQACPVDAIIGAAKLMHTVLTEECTGCERCVAPCPVDCIQMVPIALIERNEDPALRQLAADKARARYQNRLRRLASDQQQKNQLKNKPSVKVAQLASVDENLKKTMILAALERAKTLSTVNLNSNRGKPEV